MARNDFETSQERGQPVELYFFRYGSEPGAYYAYNDGETTIVHNDGTDDITYEPLAGLQRSDFESKQKQDQGEVKIKAPLSCDLVELFRVYPPTQITTVIIRSGHIPNFDDPISFASGENFPVAWRGRILEVFREGVEAELVCDSTASSMLRPGLRRHYQYTCPHALYKGRCGAVKEDAKAVATVASVATNQIVLTEPWVASGRVQSNYIKGTVEWNDTSGRQARTILRIDGTDTLVLTGPATGLVAADTVDVFLGCPRTMDGCATLHDAIITFGGFPGIPTTNPVNKNNHT